MENHPSTNHSHHIPEKDIRFAFVASLVLKALFAFGETLLGFILLFTGSISGLLLSIVERELIEDPTDFFATHVIGAAQSLSPSAQLFGAFYLLVHGIAKIFLVWSLIKNKLWAYPASIAVFALFILYQIIRYTETHSVFLILLTVFDLVVLWLIWHEYKELLRKRHI